MKNFTNNFKQFTSRLSARWLIMALMLLLGTGSAWAGMWINDNNGWNIEIERNGTSTWIGGTYGFNREDKNGAYKDYSAENTTSLKIKNAWVKASSNDNWQIRYAAIYCRVSTNQSGNFSQIKCKDYGSNKSNANSIEFQINDIAYDVVNGLAPGTYYLDYYFSVGNDGCDKGYCYAPEYNCNGTNPYCSNCQNCNYYSIKFKVPEQEKKYSLGGYIQVGNVMADKSTYYSTYDLAKQTDGTYKGTFSFSKSHNNAQYIYIVDNAGTIYGPQTNDYPMSPGDETTLSKGKSNKVQASIALNTEYVFTFNPTTGAFTYSLECTPPDFSVSLSKSEVAVGCTGVTASITGDDSPTITWSSSDTKVATIDSDGAINIKAAGTTTITATTTEAGGFCGGVEKTATLTVKSPSVKVSANKNSLCEDETLTLTATLTNCGTDNSIQWYKGEDLLTGETKDQLTISSVTTTNSGEYKAVVTGGIICSSIESSAVTITVNALPSAPSLSNPEAICEGTTFTLPEKDDSKKTITWVGVDNRTLTGLTAGTHKYTAKIVENGCESTTVDYTITVKEQLAKPDLDVTNVKQCGSNYTEGKIVINNYNPANTYILKKGGNPINKEYNDGYSLSENEIGTYTVEVSKDNACGATSDAKIIEVTNNTPTVNSFAITKQPNVCMGNPVTLSYDDTEQSGDITYAWYEGVSDVVLGTEATLTIQQARNASYKLVVTVTSNDCPASDEATTTVEPKAVPSAPTFDNDAMDACVDQQFTLPTPNNLKNGEEALWTVEGKLTTASQTIDEAGEYRYIAYKNDGCPSEGTPFTVRVNPLPTINIGEDVTAVLYEDVELTATGENIDNVVWTTDSDKGTITKDATDPKKAVLTYDQTGTVTVTATATSAAGCTSVAATKTVTFGAEVCNNVADMTKIYFDATGNNNFKDNVYLSVAGNTYNKDRSADCNDTGHAGDYWPGEDGTFHKMTKIAGTNIYYVNKPASIPSGKISIWNKNQQGNNNVWQAHVILAKSIDNNNNCLVLGSSSHHNDRQSDVYCSTWTTYANKPQITLPAAKTTLLETTEGEGNIDFNGQVVKTGCAETLTYGFAYSTDANADKNSWTKVESTNNGNTVGSTFSGSVNELQDGTYYVCAYITNSAGTAYGTVNEITVSNIKYPIENISLNYCNRDDVIIPDPNPMCKGTTAYIKLDYEGSRYSECKWLINGVATDRIQNFNNNVWVFNIQGDETVTVELRNDANKDGETPTWATSNKLTFTMVAEPTTPTVSLSPNVICSNKLDGATLSIASVAVGQTYVLYKYADENDNTGAEVDGYDALPCIDAKDELSFTNLTQAGRYFVKTYNTDNCQSIMTASSFATLEVVNAGDVFIGFEPTTATTTPWMPAKFTVNASDKYTLTVPEGVVYNINGNKVSVKIPLPEGSTGGDGQYENVTFPQGAKTSYTITANLATSGGVDNPCAAPAEATITLTPYVEPCTEGH